MSIFRCFPVVLPRWRNLILRFCSAAAVVELDPDNSTVSRHAAPPAARQRAAVARQHALASAHASAAGLSSAAGALCASHRAHVASSNGCTSLLFFRRCCETEACPVSTEFRACQCGAGEIRGSCRDRLRFCRFPTTQDSRLQAWRAARRAVIAWQARRRHQQHRPLRSTARRISKAALPSAPGGASSALQDYGGLPTLGCIPLLSRLEPIFQLHACSAAPLLCLTTRGSCHVLGCMDALDHATNW